MSKFAGVVSGPALGAAAAAGLVLAIALLIGPAQRPGDEPGDDPAGLVQSVPEGETTQQEAAPDKSADAEASVAQTSEEPTGEEQTGEEQTGEEQAGEAQTAAAEPSDAAAPGDETTEERQAVPAMPEAPSIDTFRLDPDGALLVAGQAEPGWDTLVTLDGAVLDTVSPDGAGKFVAFLQIEQSDQPRILSLMMRDPVGGAEIASRDEVIIAPTPALPTEEVAALEEATPDQSAEDTTQAGVGATSSDGVATTVEETAAPDPDTGAPGSHSGSGEAETAQAEAAQAEADPTDTDTQSQTVLLSNDEGVTVLQPATPRDQTPEVMSSVALDAITYNEAGEVELSGRGQGDGFVRVYLDNAPVTTSRIAEDGNWRTDLPEIDTGVYTLRIDETDAEGNVTSRVETPFKREEEDVIAAASAAVVEQRIAAVTVQPGSTLWAISRAAYGDGVLYVRVFEANRDRIRDPDLIYPGQVFNLPE